jgi:hypothetical protein
MKNTFPSERPLRRTSDKLILLVLLFVLLGGCKAPDQQASVRSRDSELVSFGLAEVGSALQEKEALLIKEARISWEIASPAGHLKAEGFTLEKDNGKILITGADEAGVMYGALELAEQIRLYGLAGVRETTQNPYMEVRGTKFNIPLDMRTPSYTDASDAGQQNIPAMWDFEFWQAYIDNLAKYRYNCISLWNLHPFPSLVKVPDYPEVALDDVHRSTGQWQEYHHLHATGLDAPEILANPEVVKKITIDEKIAFWQKVMAYGKSRNVKFYIITWNVFTNGTDGKYGITDRIDNETTRDYFRKSIKQLFRTYPDLAGIGLTTGENMLGATFPEKEEWAYDTYARAVLEVAQEMPDRQFVFNHRQHQAGAQEIMEKFKPLIDQPNIDFIFSFKYAQAHVYSALEQGFHEKFVRDIGPSQVKTMWELRNDDIYHFRWGAPGFVRPFIQNLPAEVMKGIYYGSDQWVWGRDFLSRTPAAQPGQLEVEKHWYQWMLWGRLSYDPTLPDDRFRDIIRHRFPEVEGEALFRAWQHASMVYPITTGFHWGALDFQWYLEGCKSRPAPAQNETGFHDVNRFISLPPHPKSGYQSIPDYVQQQQQGGNQKLTSPLVVSQSLHEQADQALGLIAAMEAKDNQELVATLQDIRTMALMGKYYAHKIAGSTRVAQFRATQEKQYQEQAVQEL